jgi:hypothetical protein
MVSCLHLEFSSINDRCTNCGILLQTLITEQITKPMDNLIASVIKLKHDIK